MSIKISDMGIVFFLRFSGGKWKAMKVIEETLPGSGIMIRIGAYTNQGRQSCIR